MLRAISLMVLIFLYVTPVDAQEWPSEQITIVAPFPTSSTADLLGRLLAEHLERRLKQSVLVVDKPGQSGLIGTAEVAKAKPDGYTMMVGTVSTHAISPYYEANPPYDVEKDFIPVALLARVPNVLVVSPDMPVKTVSELIAYLKTNPQAGTYGSAGAGTSQHVGGVLFELKTGLSLTHVPLGGGHEIMNAMASGKIRIAFNNSLWAWPLARAGKVRAIGVTTLARSPSVPGVPAISESVAGFEASSWFGLFVPAGTPRPIVEKLSAEVSAILREPFVAAQLTLLGAEVEIMSPEQFADFCIMERKKWREVVAEIRARN